jgi:DNA-binding XRE family transcriptional regulator
LEEALSITPAQVKAARKLLGWSQLGLASILGIRETTVGKFESGTQRERMIIAIRRALEAAGVESTNGKSARREAEERSQAQQAGLPGVSKRPRFRDF